MISMVFDHVGDMFFPDAMWPRMIGRLAMPVFSFCIAEGYTHTKDKKKYLCRIGVFAPEHHAGFFSRCRSTDAV